MTNFTLAWIIRFLVHIYDDAIFHYVMFQSISGCYVLEHYRMICFRAFQNVMFQSIPTKLKIIIIAEFFNDWKCLGDRNLSVPELSWGWTCTHCYFRIL